MSVEKIKKSNGISLESTLNAEKSVLPVTATINIPASFNSSRQTC